jgi:hypothetical protein
MLKLKWWLLFLLGLNAVVLAWQWDAFARWGHGPHVHREPERLQQQIRPEAMQLERIRPDAAGSALPAPAVSEADAIAVAAPDAPASADASAGAPASAPAAASPAVRP